MKVLITGAKGMVGRAAVSHCRSKGDAVSALARTDLDIGDREAVLTSFQEIEPDAVLNCAAFTDVDGAEAKPDECYRVNALGVENLAIASRAVDAVLVTISTDYVFGGQKSGFYTQRDTPDPLPAVYSRSKLEGERLASAACARTILVRSGWIFGEGGTNFLSKIGELLEAKGSVSAIGDSFGTPTYGADLARRMRQLADLDLPGLYHAVNGGDGASYADFAREVCAIKGIDPAKAVKEISADSLDRPAPRPRSSLLRCLLSERLGLEPMRDWRKALVEFIGNS